jgi:hypothetical protein
VLVEIHDVLHHLLVLVVEMHLLEVELVDFADGLLTVEARLEEFVA